MATRSRTSFQKRQKEIARMEKQRDKAAKRAQRKLNPTESEESEYVLGEDGLPILGEDCQPILIYAGDFGQPGRFPHQGCCPFPADADDYLLPEEARGF